MIAQLATAASATKPTHHQVELRQRSSHIGAEQRDRLPEIEPGGRAGEVAAIGQHDGQQLAEGEGQDHEMMAADPERREADHRRAAAPWSPRRSGSAAQKPRPKSRARIAAV